LAGSRWICARRAEIGLECLDMAGVTTSGYGEVVHRAG
jgi:hypothetical protein